MKNKYYISIGLVIFVSLFIAFIAPIGDFFKGIAILPSVGGLAAALFQLVRDHSNHQRNIELQNEQQIFNLGATSHMANTVFDKHVEFCEEYLKEVHNLLTTFHGTGPTDKALDHSSKFNEIRSDYTAWITPEIEEKLEPFESAVRTIGANAGLIKALKGEEIEDGSRKEAIKEMYDIFRSMMNIGEIKDVNYNTTIVEVKKRIREIMQINDLVEIRKHLINKATFIKSC